MTNLPSFAPSRLRVNKILEQHFNTAFAAPDGVAKLRELILTLAMQGKLVEQDPNDPPASELLKEIEAEKERVSHEGTKTRRGKEKTLPPIKPEEVPYELPQGWEWVRLPECYFGIGSKSNQIQTKDYRESGKFPVVDQGKNFITGYYDDESKLLHIDRPVIIFGDHTKNIKFVDFDFIIGADGVKVLCPFKGVSTKFLYRLIQSFDLTDRGYARHFKVLNEKLAPLPPLPEQHRIVARIDQLMARCDALEKLRKEREEKRLTVHAAAIKQLLEAKDGSAWDFIGQHFGDLYTVKENVTELRKAILQLAVMGRLVPQDPNDPPASELLKEIQAEKQRLVKAGKIKKPKPLPPIKPEEVPYELPQGWKWVMVEDVFNTTSGTTFEASLEQENGKYAYVKVGDMNLPGNELNITTSSRFVDPDEKMLRALIPAGSVIFPKRGGAIATNKKRVINTPIFVDLNIMAITPMGGVITAYAYRWLSSFDLATLNTGTSVPQINHKDVDPLPFPLPPFPEQHRIVTRINQLMALCDTLDQQIDAATDKQSTLLNAVMAQV